ncbi:type IV pilus modification PilV family protein [Tuwongella immobilis]|uniref:Uncharacterized protein n=1 Tax=Tuwongella immobilis TaxID=692036 RepID=A0A6C2YJ34_9BACT|nr:prepilin-type N-terminal cleavage/methylation domain-containing protein [Tuwongella immobilis]VIP01560.1 unnamed protein product [Tuwongella immobilis]VTR98771.1 unnamed protein product [Tuwongella immobilis]
MKAQRFRRDGFSLTEVLIAIFVMSIGLISLMVLFPFGALQMANAIKDDRTAAIADNAHVWLKTMWRRTWVNENNVLRDTASAELIQPFISDLKAVSPSFEKEPSRPVLLDPIGVFSRIAQPPAISGWVAGEAGEQRIHRRNINLYTTATPLPQLAQLLQNFSMQDDINFSQSGSTFIPTSPATERYGTYNWSYLVRRERESRNYEMRVWIMVFQRRAPDILNQESAVTANIVRGDPLIQLLNPSPSIPLRKGAWVLDASRLQTGTATNPYFLQQTAWYRIMNISDDGSQIEVDPPPQWSAPNALSNPPSPEPGMLYIFDTIEQGRMVEVFDRGVITPFSPPVP